MMEKASWIGGVLSIMALGSGVLLKQYQQYGVYTWILFGIGALLMAFFFAVNRKLIAAMFAGRRARYGTNTAFMIVIAAALVILIQILAIRHNERFDLTKNKRFTLADQSVKIVQTLPGPIKAYAFSIEGETGFDKLKDLLAMYAGAGPNFTYEIIDPNRNPGLTKKFAVTHYNTTILEYGEKNKKVTSTDEQDFTNALVSLTNDKKKTVYVLTGHNEAGLDNAENDGISKAKEALGKDNYEVKELLLLRETAVPEDCAALIVPGPQKAPQEAELKKLTEYINRGGHVLFLVGQDTPQEFIDYLKSYDFIIGNNVVVDPLMQVLGGDSLAPMMVSAEPHPITEKFKLNPVFPLVRTVDVADEPGGRITAQKLLLTSPNSWAESDRDILTKGGEVKFDEGKDTMGPLSIAAVATLSTKPGAEKKRQPDEEMEQEDMVQPKKEEDKTAARLVAVGDVDFIRNAYLPFPGNSDIFLNMIGWLAQEENLIAIRPTNPNVQPVFPTPLQGQIVFWLPVIFLPGIVAVFGIVTITQRRRSK